MSAVSRLLPLATLAAALGWPAPPAAAQSDESVLACAGDTSAWPLACAPQSVWSTAAVEPTGEAFSPATALIIVQDTTASWERVFVAALGVGVILSIPTGYAGGYLADAVSADNYAGLVGLLVGGAVGFGAGGAFGAHHASGGRGNLWRTLGVAVAITLLPAILDPELATAGALISVPVSVLHEIG